MTKLSIIILKVTSYVKFVDVMEFFLLFSTPCKTVFHENVWKNDGKKVRVCVGGGGGAEFIIGYILLRLCIQINNTTYRYLNICCNLHPGMGIGKEKKNT